MIHKMERTGRLAYMTTKTETKCLLSMKACAIFILHSTWTTLWFSHKLVYEVLLYHALFRQLRDLNLYIPPWKRLLLLVPREAKERNKWHNKSCSLLSKLLEKARQTDKLPYGACFDYSVCMPVGLDWGLMYGVVYRRGWSIQGSKHYNHMVFDPKPWLLQAMGKQFWLLFLLLLSFCLLPWAYFFHYACCNYLFCCGKTYRMTFI